MRCVKNLDIQVFSPQLPRGGMQQLVLISINKHTVELKGETQLSYIIKGMGGIYSDWLHHNATHTGCTVLLEGKKDL